MHNTRLFPNKHSWVWLPLVFWSGVGIARLVLRYFRMRVVFDMDEYWPISIFLPKAFVLPADLLVLLGIVVMWWGVWKLWDPKRLSILHVILITGGLILATNCLQGYREGFVTPLGSDDLASVHYYPDAKKITDVGVFLEYYTELQPLLGDHPRVHPPGALLVFYWLIQIWDSPLFLGTIFLLGGLGSLWLVYDILRTRIGHEYALFVSFLFGVLPGVQIYFWYMVDTLIVTAFIAVVWSFLNKKYWLMLIFAFVGSFLTFASVWMLVTLLIVEWMLDRKFTRTFNLALGLAVLYGLLYWMSGFSYVSSLMVAHSFEGPGGFYLLTDPVSYLQTRFEDILEPFVFMSPYVGWLVYKSLQRFKKGTELVMIGASGLLAFLLFLIAGAYYTGETGRAAAFLYPFYMILVAQWIHQRKPDLHEQKLLLSVVFAQSVIMQAIGWYAW